MAVAQHFRSAFNGFNREDVVHYIEYLNNQHNSQLEQLNTQLQTALEKAASEGISDLQSQLDAALARCAELEQALAQKEQETSTALTTTEEELEAYRRAERTERMARERAEQIYTQANAVLADATLKAENAAAQISAVTDQISEQLQQTKNSFQDAVATLYAIRPETE